MQQALSKKTNTSGKNQNSPVFANASRSGTHQDPLAFNVHQVKKSIRRECMLDHDAPIILSSNVSHEKSLCSSRKSSRRRELDTSIIQCMLYVSSFLLCWIFPLIARIYGITHNSVPFAIHLLSRVYNPLQGFFFILVYTRPHVKAIQNGNPELNWFQAFAIAFKAGRDNDFGENQMEIVHEEGIDAPRLRVSERQRRQEVVRQQYKRRTVSNRSSYNSRSYSNLEGKESDMSQIDGALADGTAIKKSKLQTRSNASNDEDVEANIVSKKVGDMTDEIKV